MDPKITFIGVVQSPLKKIGDCPLQEREGAPRATILIDPEFTEGIRDIQVGASLVVLTWMHLADRSVVTCISRNNIEGPVFGVFSTRSPDRPNPIGIHRVKVIAVSPDSIEVDALEVLDQTPVVDIKPVWNE